MLTTQKFRQNGQHVLRVAPFGGKRQLNNAKRAKWRQRTIGCLKMLNDRPAGGVNFCQGFVLKSW